MSVLGRHDRQFANSNSIEQRDPGQVDRDRVLYTYAFRRLAGVTQVVGPLEGHIFHNRLTHTLEVAQIARRLSEKLNTEFKELAERAGGIDPDITEAAALIHDLGHPPFGHIAEEELNALAVASGNSDGFEGNAQSFRIVTRLTPHDTDYSGLNLCRATLCAVLKYPWLRARNKNAGKPYKKFGAYRDDQIAFDFARAANAPSKEQSIEASIMDYADGVAYSVHDLDDFVRAGLISVEHLKNYPNEFRAFLDRWVDSGYISREDVSRYAKSFELTLSDLYASGRPYTGTREERIESRERISNQIRRYVYAARLQTSSSTGVHLFFSKQYALELKFLQRIVWEFVISSPRLATQQHGQRLIIRALYDAYLTAIRNRDEKLLPALFHSDFENLPSKSRKSKNTKLAANAEIRLAVDVVASFTDHQASLMYRRLTGVSGGSVADFLDG